MDKKRSLLKKFSEFYINFLSKYYAVCFVFFVLISGFFWHEASKLTLNSRLYDLFPQNISSVANISKMEKYFGGNVLTVSLKYNYANRDLENRVTYMLERTDSTLDKLNNILKQYQSGKPKKIDKYVSDFEYVQGTIEEYTKSIGVLKDTPKTKYKKLFIREIKDNIVPDTLLQYKNLKKEQNLPRLQLLIHAFEENKRAFNLYEQAIIKKLPENRKEQFIKFAEQIAKKISKNKNFVASVDYRYDKKFIKDHLLYFLDPSDLKSIYRKLNNKINYERRKNIIADSLLVDKHQGELSFKDLSDKYFNKSTGSKKFLRLDTNQKNLFSKDDEGTYHYYTNDIDDTLVFVVKGRKGSADIDFSINFINYIKHQIAPLQKQHPHIAVNFSGQYISYFENTTLLHRDIKYLTPAALLFVMLIIFISFRQIRAVIIIAMPLFSGVLWAMGLTYFLVGHLNLVSSFLVAIISGLGVNFSTHLYSRYLEERANGKQSNEALIIVFQTTFLSNITATFTTAAGFFALSISDFQGFSEFGIIAGTGMLCLLVGILLIFPSIIIILERIKPLSLKNNIHHKNLNYAKGKPFPFYRIFLVLGIAMIGISCLGSYNATFNANFAKLVAKNDLYSKSVGDRLKAEDILGLANISSIPIYIPNYKLMKKVSKKFLNLYKKQGFDDSYKIETLYNYIPDDQKKKKKLMNKIHQLLLKDSLESIEKKSTREKLDRLKELTQADYITFKNIPQSIKQSFQGLVPGYFILYHPTSRISYLENIRKIAQNALSVAADYEDKGVFTASDTFIFYQVIELIKKEAPFILLIIIIAFVTVLWLDFRSFKKVLFVLFPLSLGIFWVFGFYYVFNFDFTYFNVLMFPVIAGLGIDYGVHFMHRLEEEGIENLGFIFKTTGKTMWVAAFEDMIGFGVLVLAVYQGLASIGQFLMVGVTSCLLVASLFLPAFLQTIYVVKTAGWKELISLKKKKK